MVLRFLPVVLLAASLLLTACGTSSPVTSQQAPAADADEAPIVQPGAPGESTRPVADEDVAPDPRPRFTRADVQFMQGMIAHHAQALEMTALVPERSENQGFRLLTQRIEITQKSEIEMMQHWLRKRGQDVPMAMAHDGHKMEGHEAMMMPGMLTPDQMAELRAATGTAFEKLFLKYMIQHHEGALIMVDDLLASPGAGQETEIYRFASDVDVDQRMEIARMQNLLNDGR